MPETTTPPQWIWIESEQQYAWWDGTQYTVRSSQPTEPSTAKGNEPRRSSRRRRWPWIVAGTVVIVGVLATLGAVGLQSSLDEMDRYSQDLTRDRGDFRTSTNAAAITRYRSDGFHTIVRAPRTFVPVGVRAASTHTTLAVDIRMRTVRSPAGSAFGPYCYQDPTHGFGFVVDSDGTRELVEIAGGPLPVAVSRVAGRPIRSGRLMLTCRAGRSKSGYVELAGYVDGHKVIEGISTVRVDAFGATGFGGETRGAVPAEWVVSRFWRRGPSDMP